MSWYDLPGHVLAVVYGKNLVDAVVRGEPVYVVASVGAILSTLWLVNFGREARRGAALVHAPMSRGGGRD